MQTDMRLLRNISDFQSPSVTRRRTGKRSRGKTAEPCPPTHCIKKQSRPPEQGKSLKDWACLTTEQADKARQFSRSLKRSLGRLIANTEELVTNKDIDTLVEQMMLYIANRRQKLISRYSERTAREKAIKKVFRHLKKTVNTTFEGQCFPETLKKLNAALKEYRNILILSLEDARPAPHPAPQASRKQNFFVESQQGLQCGRHAINAFYQKKVLPDRAKFEYMEALEILNCMQEVEILERTNRPLVMHQYRLMACKYGHRHRMPTPKCFDDLNCNRLILTMEGHHVCFARGDDGEWYLLDSLTSRRTKRIKPSSYIRRHRHVHSKKTVTQRPGTVTMAVICQRTRDRVEGCISIP